MQTEIKELSPSINSFFNSRLGWSYSLRSSTLPYALSLRSDPYAVGQRQSLVENPGDVEGAAFPLDHEVGNRQSVANDSWRKKSDVLSLVIYLNSWYSKNFLFFTILSYAIKVHGMSPFSYCHSIRQRLYFVGPIDVAWADFSTPSQGHSVDGMMHFLSGVSMLRLSYHQSSRLVVGRSRLPTNFWQYVFGVLEFGI